MAKTVFTDGYFLFNTINLSSWVKSIEVNIPRDMLDVTAMGSTSKQNLPGLSDIAITVTLFQDYGSLGPDQSLGVQLLTNNAAPVEVRPTSASRSATNPAYLCNMFIESYNPVAGSVGEAQMCTVTLKPAGAWSRAIA